MGPFYRESVAWIAQAGEMGPRTSGSCGTRGAGRLAFSPAPDTDAGLQLCASVPSAAQQKSWHLCPVGRTEVVLGTFLCHFLSSLDSFQVLVRIVNVGLEGWLSK